MVGFIKGTLPMGLARVAVLDDYNGAARKGAPWDRLDGLASVEFFQDHLTDQQSLVERLEAFDIVVIERERTPFARPLFEALPRLRMLVATGPVNWSVDLDAAAEAGVVVSCTEARQDLTSELTMGLVLALARRIVAEDRAVRAGSWQEGVGTSLKGKTLGLVGLGQVGQRVARLAIAFGMNVQAWSQNLTDQAASNSQATRVTKEELLSTSDFVSLHLVLSERSRGIIERQALNSMKQSAFLINTSRGPLVCEDDLIEALSKGSISGAALDVFDVEPLPPSHAYRTLKNLITTPHIGYITDDQVRLFYGQVVENIEAFLAGRPIRILRKQESVLT